MSEVRPPLSMLEQADLLDDVLTRTLMREGKLADETVIVLTADHVEDLQHLVLRLRRMARHEVEIRKLVMGR